MFLGVLSGIGVEIVCVFVLCGVYVVMVVRNIGFGVKVKEDIVNCVFGVKLDVMELDFSLMDFVRKFVFDYKLFGCFFNFLM